MDGLMQDIRHAIRTLRGAPGFTLAALLALALGIGANTMIFSAVNTMLLHPLPYADPDRLVFVTSTQPTHDIDEMTVSLEDYRDWQEQSRTLQVMSAFLTGSLTLTGAGEPVQLHGARVTTGFFQLLGVQPARGRGFLPEEEEVGRHRVVVLSQGLWVRQFGSDPKLVGRSISLNGNLYTVVGIAPATLQFPDPSVQAWLPLAFPPAPANRGTRFLTVIARMKPGVSLSHAGVEMQSIARRLEKSYPENEGIGVRVVPFEERLLGDFRPALWLLLGAVAFVLLIACANVANLLLARSAVRRREMALRAALGAGRARLVRQLLTESVMLALMGGILGTLLAEWSLQFLLALAPEDIPRLSETAIDGRVLGFTAGLALLTGVIFGLLPARLATRTDLTGPLKEGARGSLAPTGTRGMLKFLVVGELALALILLIGAGLLAGSFQRLRGVDPGFNAENLLTVPISLPLSKYPEARQRAEFYRQALSGIAAVPGVISVGATNDLPFASTAFNRFFMMSDVEGGVSPTWADPGKQAAVFEITADYFRAMGVPLRAGRTFDARDDSTAAPAAIINETLAKRYFRGRDPLGKKIRLGAPGSWLPWMTIVGVTGETRLENLAQEPFPEVYTPHLQGIALQTSATMILALRTAVDPQSLAPAVRAQVHAIDRDQPLGEVRTMQSLLGRSLVQPRFQAVLLSLFALLALVLSAIGVYGLIAYSVRMRTSEIGIRVALGARGGDILRLILGEGSVLILAGVAIGAAGALGVARLLSRFLYGVSASDPLTFAAVSLLLAGVALLACYLPARRAAKVDPMIALRCE